MAIDGNVLRKSHIFRHPGPNHSWRSWGNSGGGHGRFQSAQPLVDLVKGGRQVVRLRLGTKGRVGPPPVHAHLYGFVHRADHQPDLDGQEFYFHQADLNIPGNDDAIRSIKLIMSIIADSILGGRQKFAASKAKEEEEKMAESSESDEVKVIDEEVEELVEGDLKLKEGEGLPKDEPIKKGPKKKPLK